LIKVNLMQFITFRDQKNHKILQAFLGLCNYLQRFHSQYAQVVAPLYYLLRKSVKWKWGAEKQQAFEQVKLLFLDTVMLRHPVIGERFYIETDASTYGLGAVVYQLDKEGNKRIIPCASRTLKPCERNYCVSEIELLAIIYSLSKFRYFVAGSPITIRSDHRRLSYLQNCRIVSGRLSRWILAFQWYDLTIKYILCKENIRADFLSRNPVKENKGITRK
jgi:hypothetical protein